MKTTTSNIDLKLREPLGSLVYKILEIYKTSNYYNFSKIAPKLYTDLENIPIEIIEQAITIYEKAEDKKKKGHVPHPSYLVAVAKRLNDELSRANKDSKVDPSEQKIIWGNTI